MRLWVLGVMSLVGYDLVVVGCRLRLWVIVVGWVVFGVGGWGCGF